MDCPKCKRKMQVIARHYETGKVLYKCFNKIDGEICGHRDWQVEDDKPKIIKRK